ncbi:YccF domain-containing protein [Haloarcula sp. CBA1130]|uniref:YccF domain-containing protein n=1 Tax=unclassified Haloarcula TaxID=2624677 RepID=UPI001248DD21|nr:MULTISPECIES: YccF domain-containing protein [unclassified Haloarcula]KAA9399411.1 YccF domain-containing protein [Haloarcula sp. CBA1129]KAA9404100.1 YccF domain-containing protein [Haloarcula sp. CBA1130]
MSAQRSLLVRAVWFLFVGWWVTGIWLSVAWLLNVTIIGIPLGIKLINRVPLVLTLKRRDRLVTESDGGSQYSLLVRVVWFVFVGWWASGVWTGVAYALTLTIVGLPLAIWMYNKLPFVVSLYQY